MKTTRYALLALVAMLLVGSGSAQAAALSGRYMFYGNSAWDVGGSANAIAPDKTALLPGQTATASSFSNYQRGLNGIIVDIDGLASPGAITLADFGFTVGSSLVIASWLAGPTPALNVQAGGGAGGTDRITFAWDDSAIQNEWLQVTIMANGRTGLLQNDVFYFGNLVGDVNGDGAITAFDDLMIINSINYGSSVGISTAEDVNRDGFVSAGDVHIVTNIINSAAVPSLQMITAPEATSVAVPEPASLCLLALALLGMGGLRHPGLGAGDIAPAIPGSCES